MTLPYVLRLLCMSLAAFFVIHMALAMLIASLSQTLIRWAGRMDARRGAAFLLAARLAPAAAAVLTVLAFCVPSYLSLEDESGAEYVGYKCLVFAAVSLALLAGSATRVTLALERSRRYLRECRSLGQSVTFDDAADTVVLVEEEAPVMASAGIVTPAVLVSRGVLNALGPDHIDAALRHERAHAESRDNFKRLCLCAAPALPFVSGLGAIERDWAKLTEWAADDRAAEGDAGRSLSLAEALVRMARLGSPKCSPLQSPFLATTADVADRVDRLLGGSAHSRRPLGTKSMTSLAGAAAAIAGLATRPETLVAVHSALERLMH